MKTCRAILLTTCVLFTGSAQLEAQSLSASGHVGTLGLGADVSVGLTSRVVVRGGVNFQPWDPSRVIDDVDFSISLPSPSFMGVVDLHIAGPFRATGGLVVFGSDTELQAELAQSVSIGDGSYTPQQIGTLSGRFETREFAPYLGLGLGKRPGSGVGVTFDLGVALQGEPDVMLAVTGPLASDPTFQADLEREEQNIQDDAKYVKIYPVISLGIVVGF